MNADDVRWLAQKVAAKAFHGISDASVEALARRVLELEADAEEHAANVRAVEREACAVAAEQEVASWWGEARRTIGVKVVEAIRARGGK